MRSIKLTIAPSLIFAGLPLLLLFNDSFSTTTDDRKWFLDFEASQDSIAPSRPTLAVCDVLKGIRPPYVREKPSETEGSSGRMKKRKKPHPHRPGFTVVLDVEDVHDDTSPPSKIWLSTHPESDAVANIRPPRTHGGPKCANQTRLEIYSRADSLEKLILVYAVDEAGNWSEPCSLKVTWPWKE